jgi:cytochrome c oxidase subunit 2
VRRGSLVRVVAIGVVVGIAATFVAILVPWLPERASEEGKRIDFVFWFTTGICIVIFAVVAAISVYSVFKFRVRPDDDSDGPPIHGHTGLEIAWTAIPAALVTAIAVVSAVALAQNANLPKDKLVVDVTARQFAWSFKYPQYGNIESGTLRLQNHRGTQLRLRALDVIHSFFVPEFRQKQDAVPGQVTRLPITPTKTGDYPLLCTELCGLGHALMRTRAIVMNPDDFEQWARSQQQSAGSGS